MLVESECTIVAIGDVYAKRGALAISALKRGCHIISDKPLTTELHELDEISRIANGSRLCIGCQLDLVENGAIRQIKQIIENKTIGQICTISISAQHPLRPGARAKWYFEPGQHGGTINDIGVHVFDLVPWLTGASWHEIVFARQWNAKAVFAPHFGDCAQFYATLDNKTTCFADLSYPSSQRHG